jgi:hypothetical protein
MRRLCRAAALLGFAVLDAASRAQGAPWSSAATPAPPTTPIAAAGSALPAIAPPPLAVEKAEILLPPNVVFDVTDVQAAAVTARDPFPIAFQGARLAAGRVLRISVRLETAGVRLAFQGRGQRGGSCGDGHLTAGAFVRVFESTAGASSGGCSFLWRLEGFGKTRRAGRLVVTLRWQLESIGGDASAALKSLVRSTSPPAASGVSGLTAARNLAGPPVPPGAAGAAGRAWPPPAAAARSGRAAHAEPARSPP